ncbi:uncharacterized protein LOC129721949 [Wyeomyia smithii]|uniref:uncharacterized protein LOC129721949 n=1 Tax=Wyeomyia smithii TaxID=174621 RepID=UPI002467BD13|nr:uncharacterized protein LOC129721949 [Wyeomyia smithii]
MIALKQMGADEQYSSLIEGLHPDPEKQQIFVDVQPVVHRYTGQRWQTGPVQHVPPVDRPDTANRSAAADALSGALNRHSPLECNLVPTKSNCFLPKLFQLFLFLEIYITTQKNVVFNYLPQLKQTNVFFFP